MVFRKKDEQSYYDICARLIRLTIQESVSCLFTTITSNNCTYVAHVINLLFALYNLAKNYDGHPSSNAEMLSKIIDMT